MIVVIVPTTTKECGQCANDHKRSFVGLELRAVVGLRGGGELTRAMAGLPGAAAGLPGAG